MRQGPWQTVEADIAPDAQAFAERLRAARFVSAFCHENPDGDTLGAAVAVAAMARRLGKRAEVVSSDPVPPSYRFLTDGHDVGSAPSLPPDVAVICDAATLERTGPLARSHADWFDKATVVNIDHHATNSRFGDVNLVDPHAAATCQVVAELLPYLGIAMDREIATALLAGIIRDSEGFSTQATTARTLQAAAGTLEAGAPIESVYRATIGDLPVATMHLWARLLGAMATDLQGRVVYTVLTDEMLTETGTKQHDADGVAEFMARGRGVQVAILFRDLGTSTRVSVRTEEAVSAAAIAGEFGGGGHLRRAGCTVAGTPAEAIPAVLAACGRVIDTPERSIEGRAALA